MSGEEHSVKVLTPRQDMTGVDRAWAAQYEAGDVVRYTKGSRSMGISPGAYAKVDSFDRERNLLTVERAGGEKVSYDPRRLQGVTVYRESERALQRRRPRAVYGARQNAEDRQPRAGHYREYRRARQRGNQTRLRPRGSLQPGRESASRLRLRGDQPQQPGRDSRPGAGERRYRSRRTRSSSTADWHMSPFPAPATMHRSTPTTPAISGSYSAARCRTRRRLMGSRKEMHWFQEKLAEETAQRTTARRSSPPRIMARRWPWSTDSYRVLPFAAKIFSIRAISAASRCCRTVAVKPLTTYSISVSPSRFRAAA